MREVYFFPQVSNGANDALIVIGSEPRRRIISQNLTIFAGKDSCASINVFGLEGRLAPITGCYATGP
jgi:hypothetical protein